MNENELAAMIYMAFRACNGGYGCSFASVPHKAPWRAAAAVVMRAHAEGRL